MGGKISRQSQYQNPVNTLKNGEEPVSLTKSHSDLLGIQAVTNNAFRDALENVKQSEKSLKLEQNSPNCIIGDGRMLEQVQSNSKALIESIQQYSNSLISNQIKNVQYQEMENIPQEFMIAVKNEMGKRKLMEVVK